MNLHLKDKVILVTGGAKGIGEAIVRLLVEEGAVAVILDQDREASNLLVSKLGENCITFHVNLSSSRECEFTVNEIMKSLGRIDGLVNNAGRNDSIGLEKGTPDKFIESLNNNAGHYYYMAHYCLPFLKKSKGSIVNIGSKTAITGQGNTSGYAAAVLLYGKTASSGNDDKG